MKNLTFAIVIQLLAITTIVLDIPVARQTIGFFYLSFMPGALILIILKWGAKSKLSFVLFSVGSSIAFVIFVGVLINTLFPLFGISSPLSILPLIVTIGTILLVISFVAYKRDSLMGASSILDFHISVKQLLGGVFLFSIPLLAVFGAMYSSSLLLFIMIISIAVLVVISLFSKILPSQLIPVVILVIAISLLFQIPFLSQHLFGYDIYQEFYVFRLTQTNSFWTSALVSPVGEVVDYNSMLSVTILPTVYSNLLNIGGEWVFRVLYLLFYSLVPLAMYQMWKQPYGKSMAFLAAFYFILFPRFYLEERRQIIGELFLVLLISLMLNTRVSIRKKKFLLVVFGAALVVSHYSIFYIFMFCALFAWTISAVLGKLRLNKFEMGPEKLITASFLLLMLGFGIGWYVFVTPDLGDNFLQFAQGIVTSFTKDFDNLQARGGTVSDFVTPNLGSMSLISMLDVIINKVPYVFLFVGFFALLRKSRSLSMGSEHLHMLSANMVILAMLLVAPSLAPAFLPQRFYHVSLIFLAPVCVFGGVTLLELVLKPFKEIKGRGSVIRGLLCIFFIVIFFFKIGIVSEIANDTPVNLSVSFTRMKGSHNPAILASLYGAYSPEEDVRSAVWLSKFKGNNSRVYADYTASKHVLAAYAMIQVEWDFFLSDDMTMSPDAYIYLRYFNINGFVSEEIMTSNMTKISGQLAWINKIYANGESEIYRSLSSDLPS